MKRHGIILSTILGLSVMGLAACNLSTNPTAVTAPSMTQPVPAQVTILPPQTSPVASAVQLATVTQAASGTEQQPTSIPSLTISTKTTLITATSQPTALPKLTSTAVPNPTIQQTTSTAAGGVYEVVLVPAGGNLDIHKAPGINSPVLGKFEPNAAGISLTGKLSTIGTVTWAEVNNPSGGTGWVDRYYLTESMPQAKFCANSQVNDLISNLTTALSNKDDVMLASITSPVHGFFLQPLRMGLVANYDIPKAGWVLSSTYVINWGKQPASGLDLKGSFSQVVLPNLLDVLSSSYTKKCDEIALGGASYTASWPEIYQNINYVSLYRPGPTGSEQNWRSWLVGIEYVDAKPTLFALNQFFWEP